MAVKGIADYAVMFCVLLPFGVTFYIFIHHYIVDLKAEKDTREILHKLNQAYPFADNAQEQNVQKYLGKISAGLTNQAFRH